MLPGDFPKEKFLAGRESERDHGGGQPPGPPLLSRASPSHKLANEGASLVPSITPSIHQHGVRGCLRHTCHRAAKWLVRKGFLAGIQCEKVCGVSIGQKMQHRIGSSVSILTANVPLSTANTEISTIHPKTRANKVGIEAVRCKPE